MIGKSVHLVFLIAVVLFFMSCKRLPDVQGRGSDFMQGVWLQNIEAGREKVINFTNHKFKITCDSFYVDLTTYSKVNYYADSCFKNGVWKEYAKGVYLVRSDSVFFEGTYTKENYKQKLSGCYQVGRYIKGFKIKRSLPGELVLESVENQRELSLKQIETNVCVPKTL